MLAPRRTSARPAVQCLVPRPSAPHAASTPESATRVRLQRVLAAAGVAARRVCEQMILDGRVQVNGEVVRTLPVFVDPSQDHVVVDGRGLPRAKKPTHASQGHSLAGALGRPVYIMLHKPAKVLSSTRDEGGRRTVMDLVQHPAAARLFPVGRLDFHGSGLVLLTNDGDLANRLTHPRFGIEKIYLAHVKGVLDEAFVADVERGLNAKQLRASHEMAEAAAEVSFGPRRVMARAARRPGSIRVALSRTHEDKTVLEVRLVDAGPRSVPDMLAEAGLRVVKLSRVGIGPLALRGVGAGRWRELENAEVKALRMACGLVAQTGTGGASASGPAPPSPAQAKPDGGRSQQPHGYTPARRDRRPPARSATGHANGHANGERGNGRPSRRGSR